MTLRPQWEWRLEDGAGPVDRPVSPVFGNRYDAEQWLGEHWRALAAQGVVAASLRHEERGVGPTIAFPQA
ncbi:MAG: hypothetical protein NVV70_06030 [Cellulomonas sp.]|uniref:Uncharacterized protein n=1 Tax=Cellulomonas gelida TaxID=1712 RepID=A0A4Y3KN94_9CELL|nr:MULTISPECIES: hypothetical protein [Cellulomonas]KMM47077.1 hypothetical protein CWIS_01705 [Cellulomonas sp. A375-1]MCR6647706.1 hypothetical protein [Cellulomonas sp.]MCR6703696.1 hypothetical protein [Cellulomonas sp.]GEA84430.1 hypothetical protein CGE01nite_16810 [Cellulomonas gelida]GGL26648.1 hypothetical protein GCM10009774_16340 [Cellulomonas gelida]